MIQDLEIKIWIVIGSTNTIRAHYKTKIKILTINRKYIHRENSKIIKKTPEKFYQITEVTQTQIDFLLEQLNYFLKDASNKVNILLKVFLLKII